MNSFKIKIISKTDILFYVSFVLLVGAYFLGETTFINKYGILFPLRAYIGWCSIGLLTIRMLLEIRTFNTLFLKFSLFLVSILIFYNSFTTSISPIYLFATLLLILTLDNVNVNKLLWLWFFEVTFLMLIVAFFKELKLIESINFHRDFLIRESLGYRFSTYGANYCFHLTIVYIYLRKKSIKLIELIVLYLANYYFYIKTDTKSAFYFSILAILAAILLKKIVISSTLQRFINRWVLLVSVLTPIFLSYFYTSGNYIFTQLDRFLTNRLRLGNDALNIYGVSFLGQKVEWIGRVEMGSMQRYLYVDSSYLNIMINYGIVLMMLVFIGFYILTRHDVAKDLYFTLFFCVILLHSMFDPQLMILAYNPGILFLGVLFNSRKNQMNKIS